MIAPLEPPDSFHLLAAHGWLELGSPADAGDELAKIAPERQTHPDVLKARYEIHSKLEQWEVCADLGRLLVELEPDESFGWINRSYALRRAPGGGLQAAYDALRPAVDRLEDLEQVTFNLACYACQLGRNDEGKQWLTQSFKAADRRGRSKQIRQLAREEPDLEPLWKELGNP